MDLFNKTVEVATAILDRQIDHNCSNLVEAVEAIIEAGCPVTEAMLAAERVCRRRDHMISQRALRTRIMDFRLWRQKRVQFA